MRSLGAGWVGAPHGRPHSQGRAAAQRRRDPGEGEPDGAIAMLAAPLVPNAHQRGRTNLEAKEPFAAGDIKPFYV